MKEPRRCRYGGVQLVPLSGEDSLLCWKGCGWLTVASYLFPLDPPQPLRQGVAILREASGQWLGKVVGMRAWPFPPSVGATPVSNPFSGVLLAGRGLWELYCSLLAPLPNLLPSFSFYRSLLSKKLFALQTHLSLSLLANPKWYSCTRSSLKNQVVRWDFGNGPFTG